ncbi:MAG: aminopeptidase, partial [Deltaproteobacteria bacterium]
MADLRITRLAQVMVSYCLEVQPGQRIALYGSPEAEPMLRALYREVLYAGGYPYPFMGFEIYPSYGGFDDIFFKEASEDQLKHVFETDRMVRSSFEGMIVLQSNRNTRSLAEVSPERQRIRNAAYADLQKTYLERTFQGSLRWVNGLYPTSALAQEADKDLESFAEFVYRACRVDRPDAVEAWIAVHDRQEKLVDWLANREQVRVLGPNVDLSFSIQGRPFYNSSGKYNMPDGEIYTGPVEDSVNGWVKFTYPAIYQGVAVEGAELTFSNGRVEKANAEKNQDYLMKMLESDPGSRHLGEFAIGTNYDINKFTGNILFDEKIGGSFHMALGAGYPETGSKNKSAIHWDMICDMRTDSEI